LYYTVQPEALTRAGTVTGQLDLTKADGTVLATPYFTFYVIPSLTNLQSGQKQ
jgi:hypothetical protein